MVIPRSTILIENPLAVIDAYADKHGNRAVAEAFVQFLLSRQAQEIFAQYGLRSVDPEVARPRRPSIRRWRTCSPSSTSAAGARPRRRLRRRRRLLPRRCWRSRAAVTSPRR